MIRFVKIILITFGVMTLSFLCILSLAYLGIQIPFLFLLYLLFFETTLIFVLTAVVVRHARSVRS